MTGKIKRRVIVGASLLPAVLVCAYLVWNGGRVRQVQAGIDAIEVSPHLMDGDVICRLGDGMRSSFIRNISPDDKRFSHLGIVRVRGDSTSVINAECLVSEREERVNEVSLPEFLNVAKAVGVYRANFIDGSQISDNAMLYLGRPFDWKFNSDDDTEIYCTELLHVILKNVAPERSIETKLVHWFNLTIIPPDVVSRSKDFDEIVYINSKN